MIKLIILRKLCMIVFGALLAVQSICGRKLIFKKIKVIGSAVYEN